MNTIGQVLQSSMRELITIKGLSEAKIEKIREAARKLDCRGSAFKTGIFDSLSRNYIPDSNLGVEVKEKRKQVLHIVIPFQISFLNM